MSSINGEEEEKMKKESTAVLNNLPDTLVNLLRETRQRNLEQSLTQETTRIKLDGQIVTEKKDLVVQAIHDVNDLLTGLGLTPFKCTTEVVEPGLIQVNLKLDWPGN